MFMDEYTNPVINNYRRGADGEVKSKEILDEKATVVEDKMVLKELPDIAHGVQVLDYTELRDEDKELKEGQFRVDYATGVLHFHPTANNKAVTITRYFGMGVTYFPASRVWLETNDSGEVIKTLGEMSKDFADIKKTSATLQETAQTAKGQIQEVQEAQTKVRKLIEEQNTASSRAERNLEGLKQENPRAEKNIQSVVDLQLEAMVSNATTAKEGIEKSVKDAETKKGELKTLIETDVPQAKASLDESLKAVQGEDGQGGALKKAKDAVEEIGTTVEAKKQEITQHTETKKQEIESTGERVKGLVDEAGRQATSSIETVRSSAVEEVSGMIAKTEGLKENTEKATKVIGELNTANEKATSTAKQLKEIESSADLSKYMTVEKFPTELEKNLLSEPFDTMTAVVDGKIPESLSSLPSYRELNDSMEEQLKETSVRGKTPDATAIHKTLKKITVPLSYFLQMVKGALGQSFGGRTAEEPNYKGTALVTADEEGFKTSFILPKTKHTTGQFLRTVGNYGDQEEGDPHKGIQLEWADIPVYQKATARKDGLLSKEDKRQVDRIKTIDNFLRTTDQTLKNVEMVEVRGSKGSHSTLGDYTRNASINWEFLATEKRSEEIVDEKLKKYTFEKATAEKDGLLSKEDKGRLDTFFGDSLSPDTLSSLVEKVTAVAPVDNLNSDSDTQALSARQGKVIKEMLANKLDTKPHRAMKGDILVCNGYGFIPATTAQAREWGYLKGILNDDEYALFHKFFTDEYQTLLDPDSIEGVTLSNIYNRFPYFVGLENDGASGQFLRFSYKDEQNGIVGQWVDLPSPVDNLTTTDSTQALSANQGKILKELIDSKTTVQVNNTLTSTSTSEALSANQGKVLKELIDGKTTVRVNNTLTSSSTTEALSANQGKVLKGLIDAKSELPSGGSVGQVLKKTSSGVAWQNDNNTTYSNATTSTAGLMSATDKKKLDGLDTSSLQCIPITRSAYNSLQATQKNDPNKLYFVYSG